MTRSCREAWYDAIDAEAIGSCYPQRAEFLYSARDAAEYDEITEMLSDLYPDVAVPKTAERWVSSVQYQMARTGHHRSASAVDLIIAATAAHHGLTVLHNDDDYRTVARHAPTWPSTTSTTPPDLAATSSTGPWTVAATRLISFSPGNFCFRARLN